MAASHTLYRNYTDSDTTVETITNFAFHDPSEFGWSAPSGYQFKHWNTARDDSGTEWSSGTIPVYEVPYYAIWELIPPSYLDLEGLSYYTGLIMDEINGKIDIGGKAGAIAYGSVDSTSTATAFTATVDGITEL